MVELHCNYQRQLGLNATGAALVLLRGLCKRPRRRPDPDPDPDGHHKSFIQFLRAFVLYTNERGRSGAGECPLARLVDVEIFELNAVRLHRMHRARLGPVRSKLGYPICIRPSAGDLSSARGVLPSPNAPPRGASVARRFLGHRIASGPQAGGPCGL